MQHFELHPINHLVLPNLYKRANMKFLILSLFISLMTYPIYLRGQNIKRSSINFYTGFALGTPDKRYDFLYEQYPGNIAQTVINKLGENSLDNEYNIGLAYRYRINQRIGIGAQVEYTLLVQDFILPVHHRFFRFDKYVFLWRDVSEYHMLQVSPQVDFCLLNAGQFRGGINLLFVANISFRKHINNYNLTRNHLEYFATESYPGLFMSYGRIRLDAGVRALHLKHQDEAIANNGLNPDSYNPFKARFAISYSIWQ